MKQIFSYDDFRAYLADYYGYMKRHMAGFSYRAFSERAGIESPNYLKLVIDGRRRLVDPTTHRFIRALGLDDREAQYFDLLVRQNQASDETERAFYTRWLTEFRTQTRSRNVVMKQGRLDFEWYVPLAEILLEGRTESEAPGLLTANFSFTPATAAAVIAELTARGALRVEEGIYVLEEEHSYFRDREANRLSFKQYIAGHLGFVANRLDELYGSGKFFCHTFTAPADARPRIDALLTDLLVKLGDVSSLTPARLGQVFQLNVQLYPMKTPSAKTAQKMQSR